MSKICEKCGKSHNSFWNGDPIELSDNRILCTKCSKNIAGRLNDLYYMSDPQIFFKKKNEILEECNNQFNPTITKEIEEKINKIFVKKFNTLEQNALEQNYSSTTNGTEVQNDYQEGSDSMYYNIGEKIKTLAKATTILGIAVSIVIGILLIFINLVAGLLVALLGAIFFYISSFPMYGFGQLISNSEEIKKLLKKDESSKK